MRYAVYALLTHWPRSIWQARLWKDRIEKQKTREFYTYRKYQFMGFSCEEFIKYISNNPESLGYR